MFFTAYTVYTVRVIGKGCHIIIIQTLDLVYSINLKFGSSTDRCCVSVVESLLRPQSTAKLITFKKKIKKIRLSRWDLAPKEVPLIRQY